MSEVVEHCEYCNADFTDAFQMSPCGFDCPYALEFRARCAKIMDAERRLDRNYCKQCRAPLEPTTETYDGIQFSWKCEPCNLFFEVVVK